MLSKILRLCSAFALILLSAMLLSACAPQPTQTNATASLQAYSDQNNFCSPITQDVVQQCSAQGGTLQKQGLAQCYTCTIAYSDAGTICTGSADCQGGCFNYDDPLPINTPNHVGQCAADNITFGCHQEIEDGVATDGMLCID